MNLIRSIDSFQGKSTFNTWFNSLIQKRVADYHRKAILRKSRYILIPEAIFDEPYQEDETDFEFADLLKRLPEHFQKVIILRLCDGLDFYGVGEELEITYEAARSRYRRAIDFLLRDCLMIKNMVVQHPQFPRLLLIENGNTYRDRKDGNA